jgi:hypothetical protein
MRYASVLSKIKNYTNVFRNFTQQFGGSNSTIGILLFLNRGDTTIGGQEELSMDIEFENEWETTSDWNEDDDEAIGEEAQLDFPKFKLTSRQGMIDVVTYQRTTTVT